MRPHSPAFHTFGIPSGFGHQANQIQLFITLKDSREPMLNVGLQWEIVTEKGRYNSNPELSLIPINLVFGIPTSLNNSQLSTYFSEASFPPGMLNNGFLPQGACEICVSAIELTNRSPVSLKVCAFLFLEELDPPVIILPLDSIIPFFPQNVQLSWQALHAASFPVEYTLEIWEMLPGLTPELIITSTPPLYVKTIQQMTTTFLGPSDPPLMVGTHYLAQVTVRDNVNMGGFPPVYQFKNLGRSPIHIFKYGYAMDDILCDRPSGLGYDTSDDLKTYIFWDGGTMPVPGSTGQGIVLGESEPEGNNNSFRSFYNLKWREKIETDPAGNWSSHTTDLAYYNFDDFKRGRTYQIFVEKACPSEMIASDTIEISFSQFLPERPYECGQPPLDLMLENQSPLQNLHINDTIMAGDTRVIITEVIGGNGNFSGEGFFKAPFIKSIKLAVEFDNILINDEYRLIKGDIITKWDPMGSNIIDGDGLEDLLSSNDYEVPEVYITDVDSIGIDENGNVVVYHGGGTSTFSQPIIVNSNTGSYVVSGGYVMPILEDFVIPDDLMPGVRLKFQAHTNSTFGFDPYDSRIPDQYQSQEDYKIPYKSVGRGLADSLVGILEGDWDINKIMLVSSRGAVLPIAVTGSNSLLIRTAGVDDNDIIYAIADNGSGVGLFFQKSYQYTNYHVHLVSVNGAGNSINPAVLENSMNKILHQGVTLSTVNFHPIQMTDTDPDNVIGATSRLITAYSPDMNRIIRNFVDQVGSGLEENHFYIFLIDNLQGDVAGFMPQGMQFGFVDVAKVSGNSLSKVLTHELGHGAFTLRHYWDDYVGGPNVDHGNLMDYGPDGTRLLVRQWERMHQQRFPLPWFDGDGDGQSTVVNVMAQLNNFKNEDGNYTFMAPSGLPITIPSNVTEICFNTGDDLTVLSACDLGFDILPFGSLRYFDWEGNRYQPYVICGANGNFTRFSKSDVESDTYVDSITPTYLNQSLDAIVGIPCFETGVIHFKIGKVILDNPFFNNNPSDPSSVKYKASGPRVAFDYVSGFSIQNEEKIFGKSEPPYSDEALTFLNACASIGNCGNQQSIYLFTHAHQISRYPGFFELCSEWAENMSFDFISDYALFKYQQANYFEQVSYQNDVSQQDIFLISEINLWKTKDASIYKLFHHTSTGVWTENFFDGFTQNVEGAAALTLELKKWEDYPCVYATFSAHQRQTILKTLSYAESTYFSHFSDYQEDVYNHILRSTPSQDYNDILWLFESNSYELYFRVAEKMNGTWFFSLNTNGLEPFVGTLTHMLQESRIPSGFCYQTIGQDGTQGFCEINGLARELHYYTANSQSQFYHCYSTEWNLNSARIELTSKHSDKYNCESLNTHFTESVYEPFDWIAIQFTGGGVIESPAGPIQIGPGSTYMLPMAMGDVMFRKFNDATLEYEIRTLANVLAIASVAVTAGSSSVVIQLLSQLDAAYSVGDLFVISPEQYQLDVTGTSDIPQSILSDWNNAGMILGIANATGLLVTMSNGISKFDFSKIKSCYQQVVQSGQSNLEELRMLVRTTYDKLRSPQLGIIAQDWARMLTHFKTELAAFELNQITKLTNNFSSNTSIHIHQNNFATIVQNNTEYAIASGKYVDEVYHLQPIRYDAANNNLNKVADLNQVKYIDENQRARTGFLEVYQHHDDASDFRFFIRPNGINPKGLPNFHSTFVSKGWNWGIFNDQIAEWILLLPHSKRNQLRTIISAWEDGAQGQTKFVSFCEDLFSTAPHPNGGTVGSQLQTFFTQKTSRINAWEIAASHLDDWKIKTDFLSVLDEHLVAHNGLRADLEIPEIFNAYKKVHKDIPQSYEDLDDLDIEWSEIIFQLTKDSKAKDFWKWVHRGRKFEKETVLPFLKDRTSAQYHQLREKVMHEFGVDLDEYDMYSQVQFKYNEAGDYFVADQAYVKWGIVDDQDVVLDIIIVENKLQDGTKLTSHQNGGKAAETLNVRSINKDKAEGNLNPTNKPLSQNTPISINNKWIKIFDSETGDEITDIRKI